MQYRRFPKIQDKPVSALGFGMMRLPLSSVDTELGKANENPNIDIDATRILIEEAYNQGINYFDTAYFYHGGNSEKVLGSLLRELGIREKVYIADKMPVTLIKEEADIERIFNEQLERLGTDYIDFYLLHGLNDKSWESAKEFKTLQFLSSMKRQGKIKHLGFSFHHEYETFCEIIDSFPWDFCQIQYNYLDEDYQAGRKGLDYAMKNEIGVIVMEPLRGGMLANVPMPVIDIFSKANKPRTAYEWAFRWVWDHQGVICALSGMNHVNQILENSAIATSGKANSLPSSQVKIIEEARDWLKKSMKVPCTGCGYCTPCPKGVAIPQIFSEWNRLSRIGALETGKDSDGKVHSVEYMKLKADGNGSDACVSCGICVKKCPQNINIPKALQEAHAILK